MIIIGVNLLILAVHDQIAVLPSLFAVHPHIFCFCGFSVCIFAVFSIFCYADLVSFFLLLILAIHPGFSFSHSRTVPGSLRKMLCFLLLITISVFLPCVFHIASALHPYNDHLQLFRLPKRTAFSQADTSPFGQTLQKIF